MKAENDFICLLVIRRKKIDPYAIWIPSVKGEAIIFRVHTARQKELLINRLIIFSVFKSKKKCLLLIYVKVNYDDCVNI